MESIKVLMVSGSDTNVGKTTIAKNIKSHFKSKYNSETTIISIDKLDTPSDGEDLRFHVIKGVDLNDVIESVMLEMMQDKNVILDIGGDQYERVIEAIREHDGVIENLFDVFIVPVTYSVKEDRLASRIKELIAQGVAPSKIHIVINNVPSNDLLHQPPAVKFPLLTELCNAGVRMTKNPIMKSSLIEETRGEGSISDYLPQYSMDEYKEKMREAIQAGNHELAKRMASEVGKMGLARGTHRSLVAVFDEIFDLRK